MTQFEVKSELLASPLQSRDVATMVACAPNPPLPAEVTDFGVSR